MNRLINTTDVSSQLPPPSHTPTPTHGIQRECYPLKTRSSAPPLITSTIDVLKNINWKYILNFCCEWNVKMTFSDRGPCDENRRDVCLSNHNSIWCLTFDMQIDTVTVLMQWMDFPVRQAGPVRWHFNQLIFSEPVSTAKFSGWRRSRRVLRVFSHRILETRPRHILTHVLKELLGSYTDDTCAGGSRQQRGECAVVHSHTHTHTGTVCSYIFILSVGACLRGDQSICLNTFLERSQNGIDRDQSEGEWTYCSRCTHPVHSILGNCHAWKKVVIILSLSVPGDIYR